MINQIWLREDEQALNEPLMVEAVAPMRLLSSIETSDSVPHHDFVHAEAGLPRPKKESFNNAGKARALNAPVRSPTLRRPQGYLDMAGQKSEHWRT